MSGIADAVAERIVEAVGKTSAPPAKPRKRPSTATGAAA
jgi:hypothetical protein